MAAIGPPRKAPVPKREWEQLMASLQYNHREDREVTAE